MGHGLFFENQGENLYGFLHEPASAASTLGVVFVHGAFEERQDAHLIMRSAAESLAAAGTPALRFDLYGHGDSAGLFEHATLARWESDAVAACTELQRRTGCQRVALVGLRLGALVAAGAAASMRERDNAPDALVLWQPVVSGSAYLMDSLRAHLASEMVVGRGGGPGREALLTRLRAGEAVNLLGYRLGEPLFRDLETATLAPRLERAGVRTLLLEVTRTAAARTPPELETLARDLASAVTLARAVEAQPLHAEGKLFYARADRVNEATARFLGGAV